MVACVQVRTITNDEGNKLLRIVRRSSGSGRDLAASQKVLLSAQGMDVPGIAKVTFTRRALHRPAIIGWPAIPPAGSAGRRWSREVRAPQCVEAGP